MPSLHSMTLSLALLIISLHCCTNTCSAFVPSSSSSSSCQQQQQNKKNGHRPSQNSSELSVGISFDEETAIADDEEEEDRSSRYHQLLLRANDCAKDEAECSLEEWDSVMSEIEFISETDSAELGRLMEGIHQMEERSSSKLGLWTSRMFSRANLPVFIVMFLVSTYGTITAPYDDIVVRVGWYVADWSQVATNAPQATSHFPLMMMYAMAAYVALSEVISGYLPNER